MGSTRGLGISLGKTLLCLLIAAVCVSYIPYTSHAAGDEMCKKKDNKGKYVNEGKPCEEVGKCKQGKCDLQQGMPPMLPMLPMPMPPMDMPMMPMDPCNSPVGQIADGSSDTVFGAERGSTSSSSPQTQNPACPQNGQSGSGDPNAGFSSNVSSGVDTSSSGSTASTVSDLFRDLFGDGSSFDNSITSENPNTTPTAGPTSTKKATPYVGQPGVIEINPGVSGNIEFHDNGATILLHRESGGAEVAGFYGSDTSGAPRGLAQTWCATRPWATNFLSRILPAVFFDGLCSLRGFAVGLVPEAPNASHAPGVQVPREPTVTSFTSSSQPRATQPKAAPRAARVDIWSVPTSVRLGSRATIFWNATGVVSCEETSPDGSFAHNTLSGGSETVAISGPTTFVISCVTDTGEHVSNYATVNLAN